MKPLSTSQQQARFEWLKEHSRFFAQSTSHFSKQEITKLLSLVASKPEALPSQNPPWVPKINLDQSLDEALSSLRQAKISGIPYFLWWELGISGDIEDSAKHLALWASGLIQTALDMAKHLIKLRFGQLDEQQGHFTVIGLGKLGGWELNLGSDVDLLFVWDADPSLLTSGGRKSIPTKEYYQHLSRLLIRLLDEQTTEGKTWLTDMRLRPNGDGAPICLSLQATLNHYQDYGQTWERAMLSKAAVVAGDQSLGKAFLEGLQPFIWRQYMDYTTVQSLAEMKQRIDKQAGARLIDIGFDVKRGHGGIREIEFIIQSLQLLFAGREPYLAVTSSMAALHQLNSAQYINDDETDVLRNAYRFWRRVEHAVQAYQGLHTHQLPEGWKGWLNYTLNTKDIEHEMLKHSDLVHHLFQHHFNNIADSAEQRQSWIQFTAAELETLIHSLFPAENQSSSHDMNQTLQNIQRQLQRQLLPERSIEQIESLTSFLLNHWQGDANAKTALQAWHDLLHTIGGRATWIDLLANQEQALIWLANMLASSGFIAKNIAKNPTWLEWPLSAQTKDQRITHICHQIAELHPEQHDEEAFLANLGRLVDEARLTTAISIASDDNFDPMLAGRWLSDVADQAVLAALKLALSQYQLPSDFPMVALAMGKHGSRSMGLVSDLDMVFILVHDDPFELGPKQKNHREWSQRVGRRMIQHLSLKPPYGAGFDFDARLRPSGSSGVLVTTLQAFHQYQNNEAQTWEHQALCRARALSFAKKTRQQVNAVKSEVLSQTRDEFSLKHDVNQMRTKMINHLASKSKVVINLKQDKGGLVDIEFLAQYACLYFHVDKTSTVEMLQYLPSHAPKIWLEYAPILTETFILYRRMENALRVHLWASVGRLPTDEETAEWETLRRHTTIPDVETLQSKMSKVHQIFKILLKEQ